MILTYCSTSEICFQIEGALLQQVRHWAYSIDKSVFEEQLSTGRYRNNRELDNDLLMVMKLAKEQGQIIPYYGVGGSSGVCDYLIKVKGRSCSMKVEHSYTGKTLELDVPRHKAWFPFKGVNGRRFLYSPFPYILSKKLPIKWSGKLPRSMLCRIAGKEYQKLKSWDQWVYKLALTDKYEFSFGTVSMGATGFVAKVRETTTGDIIDITDYEDW